MKRNFVLVAVALLFNTAYADRTVWYVHPDSALNTIQAGLDSCADNDIVLVGPGTYYENIDWPNTQGIHLISEFGPDLTIIDGGYAGCVINITTGVDTTTIIREFTIQNGYSAYGGGILCHYSSLPKIIGNIIAGNASWDYETGGGGIFCYGSSSVIENNTIAGNASLWGARGGGILCSYSSLVIESNTIIGNQAANGGGISCGYSSLVIESNTIIGNQAVNGGGIHCHGSSSTITGNTINTNIATNYGGGIYCTVCDTTTITQNIIMENTSIYGGGIHIYNSSPTTIDSCTIVGNNGDGIYSRGWSIPIINYNNITNNIGYGVQNSNSATIVNAEYNWWGDPSGPGGSGPGTGDSVSDYVDFTPWLQDSVEWIGIEEYEGSQPVATILQISPNPFRDRVNIKFSMEHSAEVIELKIYDATGRLIKDLSRFMIHDSRYSPITWLGDDSYGRKLPSGVYFVKFSAGDYSATEKLLLIK